MKHDGAYFNESEKRKEQEFVTSCIMALKFPIRIHNYFQGTSITQLLQFALNSFPVFSIPSLVPPPCRVAAFIINYTA